MKSSEYRERIAAMVFECCQAWTEDGFATDPTNYQVADEVLALLHKSNEEYREDMEIQHMKEIEQCVKDTTEEVLDRLVEKLPKAKQIKYNPQSHSLTWEKDVEPDRKYNQALEEIKAIIDREREGL